MELIAHTHDRSLLFGTTKRFLGALLISPWASRLILVCFLYRRQRYTQSKIMNNFYSYEESTPLSRCITASRSFQLLILRSYLLFHFIPMTGLINSQLTSSSRSPTEGMIRKFVPVVVVSVMILTVAGRVVFLMFPSSMSSSSQGQRKTMTMRIGI